MNFSLVENRVLGKQKCYLNKQSYLGFLRIHSLLFFKEQKYFHKENKLINSVLLLFGFIVRDTMQICSHYPRHHWDDTHPAISKNKNNSHIFNRFGVLAIFSTLASLLLFLPPLPFPHFNYSAQSVITCSVCLGKPSDLAVCFPVYLFCLFGFFFFFFSSFSNLSLNVFYLKIIHQKFRKAVQITLERSPLLLCQNGLRVNVTPAFYFNKLC